MKTMLKSLLLNFIILYSLIIPYSFSIISTDNFFQQEVSQNPLEFNSTSFQDTDILFSEWSDDLEGFGLIPFFKFSIFNRNEYISFSLPDSFHVLKKIPFKLLSIPPPSI
ncbi:MAG: hypothetical protein IPL26_08710 [Leptospiraceae bacterium]|nr:hypothetical protein [Leptospiraceae bacterium]